MFKFPKLLTLLFNKEWLISVTVKFQQLLRVFTKISLTKIISNSTKDVLSFGLESMTWKTLREVQDLEHGLCKLLSGLQMFLERL